ncbi:hypothetical protein swp_3065 [Shewanella piezotolerans WP3]|uniref:Uncharacterized protein n=1 Tax=Shewanella piezotolerans (strain WP3 / JCM 13877) TaxID=225849 RepID=B8CPR8_SHEPW|nr:hypothetical protein swp_3065 [Shewanella piezotolerans WP3]
MALSFLGILVFIGQHYETGYRFSHYAFYQHFYLVMW